MDGVTQAVSGYGRRARGDRALLQAGAGVVVLENRLGRIANTCSGLRTGLAQTHAMTDALALEHDARSGTVGRESGTHDRSRPEPVCQQRPKPDSPDLWPMLALEDVCRRRRSADLVYDTPSVRSAHSECIVQTKPVLSWILRINWHQKCRG